MRNIPPLLNAHLQGELLTPALCLRIERADGVVLSFTSHDRALVLDGTTFRSGVTFNLSAIRASADFSVDNAEIEMGIDGIEVTVGDLASASLRDAAFTLYLTNWADTSQGYVVLKRGEIGETEIINELYVKIQLRGLMGRLGNNFLEMYSPTCRATFGDKRCGYANLPDRIRQNGKEYIASDWFVIPAGVVVPSLSNLSFEADGIVGAGAPITAWEILSGEFKTASTLGGIDGSYYIEGATGVSGTLTSPSVLRKIFTTSSIGMTGIDVDNGLYTLSLGAAIRNTIVDDRSLASISLSFFAADGRGVGGKTLPPQRFSAEGWDMAQVTTFVPPQTRSIHLTLFAYRNGTMTPAVAFDAVQVSFWRNEAVTFGGLSYKVSRVPGAAAMPALTPSNAISNGKIDPRRGRSASSSTAFGPTVGDLTADGDLIVETRPATFGYGNVTNVTNGRTVETLDITVTPAEMFGGRLVWLSGINAGRISAVRSYDAATHLVTLYAALPSSPTVGDRFVWARGCDKTISTCAGLKNNFNFRGEPYIPGPSKTIQFMTTN